MHPAIEESANTAMTSRWGSQCVTLLHIHRAVPRILLHGPDICWWQLGPGIGAYVSYVGQPHCYGPRLRHLR